MSEAWKRKEGKSATGGLSGSVVLAGKQRDKIILVLIVLIV